MLKEFNSVLTNLLLLFFKKCFVDSRLYTDIGSIVESIVFAICVVTKLEMRLGCEDMMYSDSSDVLRSMIDRFSALCTQHSLRLLLCTNFV